MTVAAKPGEARRRGAASRWVAVPALVAALFAALTPVAAAAPSDGCPGQQAPPPPYSAEESPAPAALPVPEDPVGGARLGTCGDLVTGGRSVPSTVGSASFVLADLDTGEVLAVRAPHARHRPASTIKVLTALVAVDGLDPDRIVEGTAEDAGIEGSRAGIGPGGRYTVRQLLAGLLLDSGNDTAAALARALGGEAVTVAAMSEAAAALGALDTRPATPSGLDGPGAASSAYDLALLFRAALRDPLLAQTIRTTSIPFPGNDAQPGFVLSNSSTFLARYPGALGGKTGFTDAARQTFVGAAAQDGRRLVVAMMRGERRPVSMTKQAAALLDLGFALPPGAEPLGVLVDPAPAVATPTRAPGTAQTSGVAQAPGMAQAPPTGLPAPVGGVLLVGVLVFAGAVAFGLVRHR